MLIFIHGRMRPQPASIHSLCQSSCPCVCVCPVHQVIVHEVPGQELEVEVYDKDTDQDDFLGRYICIFMSLCAEVQLCIVTHLSSFLASWKNVR